MLLSSLLAITLFTIARNSMETLAFDQLRSVRESKASSIESELRLIGSQLDTLASSPGVKDAMVRFTDAFDGYSSVEGHTGDYKHVENYYRFEFLPRVDDPDETETNKVDYYAPGDEPAKALQETYIVDNPFPVGEKDKFETAEDGSTYDGVHTQYHDFFSRFLDNSGFYDLFLIDNDGNIVYTVFKEVDFATNLKGGPYADSGLGEVWDEADSTLTSSIVDFAPYTPSYNQPAAFLAQPVIVDGDHVGTVAVQAPVDQINEIMTNDEKWEAIGLGDSGETYIVAADGTMRNDSRFLVEEPENYFTAIEEAGVPEETIDAINQFDSSIGLQEVDTEGTRDALLGNTGEQIFSDYRGVSVLSSYRPLNMLGLDWVIMSEIDDAEAFSAANSLRTVALLTIGGGTLILFAGIFIASGRITRPLAQLEVAADDLAHHDFSPDAPTDSFAPESNLTAVAERPDEIGDLARSFTAMRNDLTTSVGATIAATQAKEAIESELNVAAEIQMAMLPLTFPDFPEVTEFVIHARLIPAKEIGGDFYEFGFVDADHFFFCVGDVSGKGIPSALFMAAIKTLIRSGAIQGEEPSALLTRINSELARENPQFMFATVWFGVLDLRTGSVKFANGGHNFPFVISDGSTVQVQEVHGPLVGPIKGASWQQGTLQIGIDDKLVVYSDGVTEAMDPSDEQFGDDRLEAILSEHPELSPVELTAEIVDNVIDWEQGDRSDDVTVLVLEYVEARRVPQFEMTMPTTPGEELSDAIVADIAALNANLGAFATSQEVSDDVAGRLQTALDELLVNVASHSGATAVTVKAWLDDDNISVEVTDDGTPFNIMDVPVPDTSGSLSERQVGGLGLHMVRSLMDEVSYERIGDRNVVTVVKRLGETT